MYEFLIGSLLLLGIWTALFLFRSDKTYRREMLKISIFTSFLGLTEPLFVPEYWNPQTLFNLAARTGFDLESLVFAFAAGGIASVVYESVFKVRHIRIGRKVMQSKRHRYHKLALVSPIIFFFGLELLTKWNPIYTTALAMLLGAAAYMWCRPDLARKMLLGGAIFVGLYFAFFFIFNLIFPGWVQEAWNFATISGILIFGIPIEELMFAAAFGLLWSGLYEHFYWLKVREK